ncbi:STAS/SEC14 domain-containing protein [Niabella insulamsoli]|uniref:STAS/SEC14 domain-containing protein n=1 Tax=Niabella insulamsoli TaxID=3144874 RepID=UPI0031FDE233
MISQIDKVPENVIAFRASGNVELQDFTSTQIPAINEFVKNHENFNYLLFLENDLNNFSLKWWMKSLWMVVRDWTTWNKCAIISNIDTTKISNTESWKELPDQLRIYPLEQSDEAVRWLKS